MVLPHCGGGAEGPADAQVHPGSGGRGGAGFLLWSLLRCLVLPQQLGDWREYHTTKGESLI